MKEASGELNMTLITIVAVALIAGLFALLYPTIQNLIVEKWGDANAALNGIPSATLDQKGFLEFNCSVVLG